ncbi:hypothetical protein NLU13_0486 [Sarocladium strictum]|uniref:Glycosyltransferase family 31 protein n=1 Tax=Sarocladium strictum TaxID=5046 RepID=A0AA39GR10_SARSR|nr:hypothetical protein NLU13_0486 [Sarocladium strictum]
MFLLTHTPNKLTSRLLNAILTLLFLTVLIHCLRLSQQPRLHKAVEVEIDLLPDGSGTPESKYLNRLARDFGLTKHVHWQSWRIRPTGEMNRWSTLTEVNLNFGSKHRKVVEVGDKNPEHANTRMRMDLPVHASPAAGRTDGADFLFGVATTFERISANRYDMVRTWSRWLTDGRRNDNGATLIVMLTEATESQVNDVDIRLQSYGIDAYVTATDEPMSSARQHQELAQILSNFQPQLAADGQMKRWFGLIEDNVFFPSLIALRERLFDYNSEKEHYIGLPSERADWDEGKRISYGGGVVFFTRTALITLNNQPCGNENQKGGAFKGKRWDVQLQQCFFRHTNMKMHVLPGFYSPLDDEERTHGKDIGVYETGARPMLLHDATGRHGLNLGKAHLVTEACGKSCFMQRYAFHDNWILVNGISISHYPQGVKKEPHPPPPETPVAAASGKILIEQGGGSGGGMAGDEAAMMLRPKKGHREVWKLIDSSIGAEGMIYQAYLKRADKGSEDLDSVIVLLWEPAAF